MELFRTVSSSFDEFFHEVMNAFGAAELLALLLILALILIGIRLTRSSSRPSSPRRSQAGRQEAAKVEQTLETQGPNASVDDPNNVPASMGTDEPVITQVSESAGVQASTRKVSAVAKVIEAISLWMLEEKEQQQRQVKQWQQVLDELVLSVEGTQQAVSDLERKAADAIDEAANHQRFTDEHEVNVNSVRHKLVESAQQLKVIQQSITVSLGHRELLEAVADDATIAALNASIRVRKQRDGDHKLVVAVADMTQYISLAAESNQHMKKKAMDVNEELKLLDKQIESCAETLSGAGEKINVEKTIVTSGCGALGVVSDEISRLSAASTAQLDAAQALLTQMKSHSESHDYHSILDELSEAESLFNRGN